MESVRDPNASDFCYYPFFQVLVTADGKYKVCCKHYDPITHDGQVLTTKSATIKEAWESDYMTKIRQAFLDGQRFKGCKECWRMQSMGLRSMRYDSYQYAIPESQVSHPVNPLRIEINSSNVCNLRCRICFATASTKWLQEAIDLYDFKEQVHLNLHTRNLKEVKQWADNLVELCLFGGEPLLSEENLQLLDFLIERGVSKNISLLFNTNATVFDDDIVTKLTSFKKVRISLSIDDLFERFEYQRKGAVWNEVESNLRRTYGLLTSLGRDRFDLKICVSVSLFNIYYIPEFFAWFQREFPELIIYFNYIYDPTRFNVQILPEPLKKLVESRLRTIQVDPAWEEREGGLIGELIGYLNQRVDMPFSEFFRLVNRHDVYRGESFPDVFPEWWQHLAPYCPEDVVMGRPETPFRERIGHWMDSGEFRELIAEAEKALKPQGGEAPREAVLMAVFEQRRRQTEKIHQPELYRLLAERVLSGEQGYQLPDSAAGWVSQYLGHLRTYLGCGPGAGLNGHLHGNLDWIAARAHETANAGQLLRDLLVLPAGELARDLSRTPADALEADFHEKYSA